MADRSTRLDKFHSLAPLSYEDSGGVILRRYSGTSKAEGAPMYSNSWRKPQVCVFPFGGSGRQRCVGSPSRENPLKLQRKKAMFE
jgi:hypothetical protein